MPLAELQALTGDNLSAFILVLVALMGLFILAGNAVDAARKMRRPQERKEEDLQTHQEACGKKFASDQLALADHNQRIEALEEGQRVMCAALHELLEHELHNGNADKMRRASSDLFDWLNRR
jgi:hypothetical protein